MAKETSIEEVKECMKEKWGKRNTAGDGVTGSGWGKFNKAVTMVQQKVAQVQVAPPAQRCISFMKEDPSFATLN
jgi:hypothetical protein